MNAGFARNLIDVKNCRGNCSPVLYEKDVLEILWRSVLMVGMEKYFPSVGNWKRQWRQSSASSCKHQLDWIYTTRDYRAEIAI